MKKALLIVLVLVSSQMVSAQFGLNAGYRSNQAPEWILESVPDGNIQFDLLASGYSFGIDYWFRLKNVRVEFTPELNYALYNQTLNEDLGLKAQTFNFFFHSNIYFLDFNNDCDCPTFSKDGNSFSKGLFLRVSPGVSLFQNELSIPESTSSENAIAFSVALGLGVDIGISDFLTISPIVTYRYYPGVDWTGLSAANRDSESLQVRSESSSIRQLHAGIRIGIRLDDQ